MKKIYNILKEPVNRTYKKLLLFSLDYCDKFLYVVPHHISDKGSVKNILKMFEEFQISVSERLEWPGTISYTTTSTVYEYKLNLESIKLLIKYNNKLYSWVQPNFPEDICLLRFDKTPWLITITQESEGYFELTGDEKRDLEKYLPELSISEQIEKMVD